MEKGACHRTVAADEATIDGDLGKDLGKNYQHNIKLSLRSMLRQPKAFVHSGSVSLEGLRGLPRVSLRDIGNVVPFSVEHEG
jgi:hypothetical protein